MIETQSLSAKVFAFHILYFLMFFCFHRKDFHTTFHIASYFPWLFKAQIAAN